MYRIFTAPQAQPGTRTLMADAETWAALMAAIGLDDLNRYAVINPVVKAATGDPMRKVTLPDELAAYVLGIAGVSA